MSGSAIGYYGNSKTESFTEQSPAGDGFVADVCREWEAAAAPVRTAGIRLVTIRTGTVLGRGGGMLDGCYPSIGSGWVDAPGPATSGCRGSP